MILVTRKLKEINPDWRPSGMMKRSNKMTENELFSIAERGLMQDYLKTLTMGGRKEVVGIIFNTLVGTCLGTLESTLESFGLNVPTLKLFGFTEEEIDRIFDDTVHSCPSCGWWYSPDDGVYNYNGDEVCCDCEHDNDDYDDDEGMKMNNFGLTQLDLAMKIAMKAHEKQEDKAGFPYVLHPLHLMNQFETEDMKILAVLHDVVEDSSYTLRALAIAFPAYLIEALDNLTKRKNEDYFEYLDRVRTNPWRAMTIPIKIADLKHNSDISRLLFITEKDIQRMEKYKKALDILEKEVY